jgi:hypothetical protein
MLDRRVRAAKYPDVAEFKAALNTPYPWDGSGKVIIVYCYIKARN